MSVSSERRASRSCRRRSPAPAVRGRGRGVGVAAAPRQALVVDVGRVRPVRRRAARPAAPRPAPRRAVVRVADLGRRRRLRPRDGRRDLARRPPKVVSRARAAAAPPESSRPSAPPSNAAARAPARAPRRPRGARRVAERRPAAHGLLVDAVAHELDLAAVQVLRVRLERALAAAHLAVVGQARVGLVLHACRAAASKGLGCKLLPRRRSAASRALEQLRRAVRSRRRCPTLPEAGPPAQRRFCSACPSPTTPPLGIASNGLRPPRRV